MHPQGYSKMMIVPTYVGPSEIEGVGVFAAEPIPAGTAIWTLDERFDHLFKDVTEVDVRAFYTRDRWKFQLAVENVFDSTYYSPEDNGFAFAVSVNPGRLVTGRVSYQFGR